MNRFSALLFSAIALASAPVFAADVVVPLESIRTERFIPLAELSQHPDLNVVLVVDPLAAYSNVTTFLGQAFAQGPATGGITRMVMDDLTFTTNPDVGAVTTIRFSVANLNAVAHSVRARVRVWNADGASLGVGLPNGPGTYYAPGGTPVGFSFNAFTFSPGVTTLTGTTPFALPAGATTTLWFGITFDNVGTTTAATDTELSNFGQGFFSPVDIGSSADVVFQTTAAGSFFPNPNPAGATVTFGATAARQGWELVVASLGTAGSNADLSITKTDGVATVDAGGSLSYIIVASNAGPSAATGATVADTFPASLTCTWTCVGAGGGTCTAAGSGNINDTVNLPAGGNVTYTASCALSAAATGALSNTATVTAPVGVTDPTPANNSATDTDTITLAADLSITKADSVTSVTPGGSTTYTIVASNAGPSNSPVTTITDTFPADLTCTWTCVGAGGGTCTAAGSGNIADTANLPAGGSVTYTASCTISGAASGSISNTATVAGTGPTDPNPANNSATDTDMVSVSNDLTITKTDGVTSVAPGGSLTYTIVAGNSGPQAATGAVVDNFPAECSSVTWTCVGAGGANCPASGSGSFNHILTLPVNASATYTAVCVVNAATPNGTVISNTATNQVYSGGADPVPGNNSATDTTTVTVAAFPDVSASKSVDGTFAPNGAITYTIVLNNSGTAAQPDNAGNEFVDVLPAGLTLVSASATSGTAVATIGTNTVSWNGAIAAAGTVTITINATVNADATGEIDNQGSVSFDGDGNGSNETTRPTDDPETKESSDPTSFSVAAVGGTAIVVPAASVWGLMLLGLLMLGLGLERRHA